MAIEAITVRPATTDDAAAIARVHVEACRVGYHGLLPDEEVRKITLEQRIAFWKSELAKPGPSKIDVAQDAAGVVGFCSYGPTRDNDAAGAAEIYAVYVHPDTWRRGAGRRLCQRAALAAAERAHDAITLWVVKGNGRACRFYERIGFRPDGGARSNTRFLATPFDEIRYRKAL